MKRPGVARSLWWVTRLAVTHQPRLALAQVGLALLNGLNVAGLVGLKLVVDAAISGDLAKGLLGAGLFAGLAGLGRLANNLGYRRMVAFQEATDRILDLTLMELALAPVTTAHHDETGHADQLELIGRQRRALSHVVPAIVATLVAGTRLVVALGVLVAIHPLTLLLLLFAIPAVVSGQAAERSLRRRDEAMASALRRESDLLRLATDRSAAKEVRVFSLGPVLLERFRNTASSNAARILRSELRTAAERGLGWIAFVAGYGLVLVLLVLRTGNGEISAGDLAVVLTLGAQLNGLAAAGVYVLGYLWQGVDVSRRLVSLQAYADLERSQHTGRAHPPSRLEEGISLQSIEYRYPEQDRHALSDVDLFLPAGHTVALVGANGAGKTTLVSLLCSFRDPTRGRILVDGTPLENLDPDRWRTSIAAGFQDFVCYELLARENVGIGDLPHIDDAAQVEQALERSGGAELIRSLPRGLETQLGATFEGVDLSGGEWQKLALGRAMMRPDPLLVVLDEPTAALDAAAERTLFNRYSQLARARAQRSGTITVLVTHRFSSARAADLVVVLHRGRVEEVGSHNDLLRAGGRYARLHHLHERAYA